MKNNRLLLIPTGMLLLALFPLPYGYYTLLRIVIFGVAVWTALIAYDIKKMWAVWLFGFVAVLFNPFIPIRLDRNIWAVIDVATALLFLCTVFYKPRANHG
jgi:hypothetical protein